MRILRVFPRRTSMTPTDYLVRIGFPGLPFDRPEADEVHISVVFSWDIPKAHELLQAWSLYYDRVLIGGPALGSPCDSFKAARYVQSGVTFTSRGCPNNCWFCLVPEREGKLRPLKNVVPGWIVQDNNLAACPRSHLRKVFAMLRRQKKPIQFSGGIEAARVDDWFVQQMRNIRLGQLFLAYDRPGELKHVRRAAGMFRDAGIPRDKIRCFVLIGGPDDTLAAAEGRCVEAWDAGTLPFAMLYHDVHTGRRRSGSEWARLQRVWCRPALTKAHVRSERAEKMPESTPATSAGVIEESA